MNDDLALASLMASRICHDLISPIGAINNGLELLAMTDAGGEEVTLISASAQSAADSLKFMRIAFGSASATEMMHSGELARIASAHVGTQRLSVRWGAEPAEFNRAIAKLTLLMTQAAATAAPLGGELSIEDNPHRGFRFEIAVTGPKVELSAPAATAMRGAPIEEVEPRFATFALLARTASAAGYTTDWTTSDGAGRLALS